MTAMLTPPLQPATEVPVYRVGTLVYTKRALVLMFFWMLWGDFVYMLMEAVIPSILPLQLKNLGASNSYIALLVGTIPQVMNFVINPVVSVKSDRHRGRFGRRVPFLLIATPPVSIFLALLAFTPEISAAIGPLGGLGMTTITLGVIGVLIVGFQFFNMILSSVYYYLFNDVVPEQFLGRFTAMFRVVGQIAGFTFSWYVYPHWETYTREIYLGAAGLYFVGFMLMCWQVREGEYPPPPPSDADTGGIFERFLATARGYLRDCFGHRVYVLFFALNATLQATVAMAIYDTLFLRSINIDDVAIGHVRGYFILAGLPLILIAGVVIDRIGAMPIYFVSVAINLVLMALAFFLLHDKSSWILFGAATVPITSMRIAAQMPFAYALLPRDRYGQFSSANALVVALVLIGASQLGGVYMDTVKSITQRPDYYRYMYIWSTVLHAIALGLLVLLYRAWRSCGGGTAAGYKPPVTCG